MCMHKRACANAVSRCAHRRTHACTQAHLTVRVTNRAALITHLRHACTHVVFLVKYHMCGHTSSYSPFPITTLHSVCVCVCVCECLQKSIKLYREYLKQGLNFTINCEKMSESCLLLSSVFVQVRLVQRVPKEILVHRDILDLEAQMVWKETRDKLVSQVLGFQDNQEKR